MAPCSSLLRTGDALEPAFGSSRLADPGKARSLYTEWAEQPAAVDPDGHPTELNGIQEADIHERDWS